MTLATWIIEGLTAAALMFLLFAGLWATVLVEPCDARADYCEYEVQP